jgi:hypothetical protein
MSDPKNPSSSLRPILLRFAADSLLITQLVAEDEGFRSLVEDCILTLNTLRKLKHQMPRNQSVITEYESILQDLEHELNISLSRWREAKL